MTKAALRPDHVQALQLVFPAAAEAGTTHEVFGLLCAATNIDTPTLKPKRMHWAVNKFCRKRHHLRQWPDVVLKAMRTENAHRLRQLHNQKNNRMRTAAARGAKEFRKSLLNSWSAPLTQEVTQPEHHDVLAWLPAEKFYKTREWLALRIEAFRTFGRRCVVCGAVPPKARIDVHHMEPRSVRPARAFDITNLEVLCESCHRGKHATRITLSVR